MTRVLIERSGRVYLVQRAPDAAQMAGMWELPVWRGPKRETGRSWQSRGETRIRTRGERTGVVRDAARDYRHRL